jgi:hypothetical protein
LFLTIQKPDRIFPTKLDHFIQKKKFKWLYMSKII